MPPNPYSTKLADAKKRSRDLQLACNRAVRDAARATLLYESEYLQSERVRGMINGSHRLDEEALPSLRAECRRACIASETAWEDREASKARATALTEELRLSKIKVEELQGEVDAWARSQPPPNTNWSFSQLLDALPIFGAGTKSSPSDEPIPNSKTQGADDNANKADSNQEHGDRQDSSSDDDLKWPYYPPSTQTPPRPLRDPEAAIAAFHHEAQQCLNDYATIEKFPEPPVTKLCIEESCVQTQEGRALIACSCNIRAAFATERNLKTVRLSWHPDKFGRCPEHLKGDFQCKAKEMFVVLNEMYLESLAKEA